MTPFGRSKPLPNRRASDRLPLCRLTIFPAAKKGTFVHMSGSLRLGYLAVVLAALAAAQTGVFTSSDLFKLRSAGGVALSPDGKLLAYSVSNNDGPGRPYSQLWVMTLADGHTLRLAREKESSDGGVWSPDGRWIAYGGHLDGKSGLIVAHADGTGAKFLSPL